MKIKSITDVITNSSTEVFIVKKDEINPKDLHYFTTYNTIEEVYEYASKYDENNVTWEMQDFIRSIYNILNIQNYNYCFDLDTILYEYDLGGLSKELGYNLVDVLKFLEPLWKDKLLNYGICMFADDENPDYWPQFNENYKMTCRI